MKLKSILPPLSIDLIERLDEDIPERCPRPDETLEDIMFYAGQRAVVRKLLAMKKEAEQEEEGEAS